MADMVEVTIDSVRVSLMSPQRIVILREKGTDRFLPIWVGPYEAEAITVALQEVEVVRPMTHDLLKNMFSIFKALLVRVEILTLKQDIYYGNIVAEVDGNTINIDARSSDAIALAVRAHIPIMVHDSVMKVASISPEADIQNQEAAPADDIPIVTDKSESLEPEPRQPSSEETKRLSVFDDFLHNMDKKDPPGNQDNQEPPTS